MKYSSCKDDHVDWIILLPSTVEHPFFSQADDLLVAVLPVGIQNDAATNAEVLLTAARLFLVRAMLCVKQAVACACF